MAFNIGEEIVSAYLHYVKGCEFIQQNVYTRDVQGEIDVVGIHLQQRAIYICEVAVHLTLGLQYVKGAQPNNVGKIITKFSKDIEYANKYFPDYEKHFMFWSPIVKTAGERAKVSQMRDVEQIAAHIQASYGVAIEWIINERFAACLAEMRQFASRQTQDLKSPVMRFMQVEEYLRKHTARSSRKIE